MHSSGVAYGSLNVAIFKIAGIYIQDTIFSIEVYTPKFNFTIQHLKIDHSIFNFVNSIFKTGHSIFKITLKLPKRSLSSFKISEREALGS